MEGLEQALEMYLGMTKNLIMALKNEDYDNLKYLADEREKTIEYIKTLKYSNDEFKDICDKLQVVEYQKLLDNTAAQKRIELKKEMNDFSRARVASNSYSKKMYDNHSFFNKKI